MSNSGSKWGLGVESSAPASLSALAFPDHALRLSFILSLESQSRSELKGAQGPGRSRAWFLPHEQCKKAQSLL